jgi:DNA-binding NarL/FixJ family response regulator
VSSGWRRAGAKFLKEEGFEVREASNAHSGLRQIGEHRPEVIVLDLEMPSPEGERNGAGLTFLRALAGREARPGVVAFAADPTSATARTAQELGAVAVLDRAADLAKLPVGESLGWKICTAWHWQRRRLEAVSAAEEKTSHG